MTVACNPQFRANLSRTVSNDGAADYTVSYNGIDRTGTQFNADSTPPVDDCAAGTVTPGSGTATINLAAVTDTPTGTTRDFTGKKVVYCRFRCPPTNGAVIKVKTGASNGYSLQGGEEIWVYPGGQHELVLNDGLTDVASGARTIDCVGTDAADSVDYAFAVG